MIRNIKDSLSSGEHYDVIVVGAGVGGISAAILAARTGARVALLETGAEIGGTGIHSPVGLVCTWFDKAGRFINRGVFEELLPYLYDSEALAKGVIQTYDEGELEEAYLRILGAEPTLTVITSCTVSSVNTDGRTIHSVGTSRGDPFVAKVFIDSTADGNLAALAGAEFQKGRVADGKMQPCTLTFRVENVDFTAFGMDPSQPNWARWDNWRLILDGLQPYFRRLKDSGGTSSPKEDILCFPDRKGKSLLFNQTRIANIDPTNPESLKAGMVEGRKQAGEFWEAVRSHPAFAKGGRIVISKMLGVREGRRIVGDYILTVEDCLGEARFKDMVAACGYPLDIHDPSGTAGTHMEEIPGSGYYHIPYRSLISKSFDNLLLGSRCISGTHEAHSSYRVMPPISSIGMAAGVAAGLCVKHEASDVRKIDAAWIRYVLKTQNQFVEGDCAPPPSRRAGSA